MTKKVTNGLDLQSQRIQNVGDPSASTDAANRNYVDNVARGLSWKMPVRAASTGNVSLSAPGSSLDGVTLAVNDRILLKNQTAGAENGIYVWSGASSALARANDADNGTELNPGTSVTVTEGTANGDKVFQIISDAAVTIGTTSTTWGQLGGGGQTYTGSNGVSVSGANITGVAASGGGLTVGASGFSIDTSVVARKVSGNVGNGTLTSIDFVHSLGVTNDLVVSLKIASTGEEVIPDYVVKDANTITLSFPSAPAAGFYRCTVIG
ncbi:hypothetical protein [Methylobacterium sp. CM6257]